MVNFNRALASGRFFPRARIECTRCNATKPFESDARGMVHRSPRQSRKRKRGTSSSSSTSESSSSSAASAKKKRKNKKKRKKRRQSRKRSRHRSEPRAGTSGGSVRAIANGAAALRSVDSSGNGNVVTIEID